ncbi:MAG: hypothetical protein A2161_16520 [Candidatus Schekmanbacteria bacterium RBG_13_48_7]|uniref:TIGR00374 family protein n=1 Tax=Candidatus Schekmanbacteria bacterium RBG_13_48_7 TaxID=1817878 RepID=A0A1F7RY20_9BACT|nr:MAG: hypothetical protein A2161_16520 [Candidatus Schekmanbacteria bacterium RBG_13_48_7]
MSRENNENEKSAWIWTVVRLSVVAVIFFFLFKSGYLNPAQLKDALNNPFSFLVGLFFVFMSCALSVERWRKLLQAQDISVPYLDAFNLTFIGIYFSTVIPGAVSGDIIKAYYVVRGRGKKPEAIMTIFLDRILGLYTMVCVAGVVILTAWATSMSVVQTALLNDFRIRAVALSIGVIFVTMTMTFAIVSSAKFRTYRLTQWILEHVPFKETVRMLYDVFYIYRQHPRESLQAVFYSFIAQVPLYAGLFMMTRTVNTGSFSIGAGLFIFPVGLMVNAIPILPGGWGQGEAGFEWLFGLFHSSLGAEVAFLFHISTIILAVGIGGGIYLFSKKHYTIKDNN